MDSLKYEYRVTVLAVNTDIMINYVKHVRLC